MFSYYIRYRKTDGNARGKSPSTTTRSRDTQGRENASLKNRTGDRSRTGRRTVLDPGMWLRVLLVTAVFVVSISALACAVGLARDTTDHDWHATYKLYWAEILLGLYFDPRAPVTYRTRKGEEVTLARGDLTFSGEALLARDHLLRTAKRSAELGAWCGLGGALLCQILLALQGVERGSRPAPPAPPRERPGFMAPMQAAKAPVRTQAVRPQGPDATPPVKPEPAGKGHGNAAPNKADSPTPERRERGYGRWI